MNKLKSIGILIVCLFSMAILTCACGSSKSEAPDNSWLYYYMLAQQQNNNGENNQEKNNNQEEGNNVNVLKVSKSLVSILVGGEDSVTVTLNDEDVTSEVTFTVDDETVATVANGTVTGVGARITTVEVSYEGAESVTFVVYVTEEGGEVFALKVSEDTVSVAVGGEGTVKVTLEDVDVTDLVIYTVDDESIATVDKGTITGVSEGTATVKVSLENAGATTFTVEVISNTFATAEKGDVIEMGSYPQTAEGGVLPIEWQVLDKKDNRVLVVSRYGLEGMSFNSLNNGNYDNVWATSAIRAWLNNHFYNTAFTDAEKGFIASVSIVEDEVSFENGDTNVFLLSYADVLNADYGFSTKQYDSDPARQCVATEYAKASGCDTYTSNGVENCCYWWLRSAYPSNARSVYYVYCAGGVYNDYDANITYFAVRPALWINL